MLDAVKHGGGSGEVAVGGFLRFLNGVGSRGVQELLTFLGAVEFLCGEAAVHQLLTERPRVCAAQEDPVFEFQKLAVLPAEGFEETGQDAPRVHDLLSGVVLAVAAEFFLQNVGVRLGEVHHLFRDADRRRPLRLVHESGFYRNELTARLHEVFGVAQRNEHGVAHDVADVGSGVAQHGEVAPRVPPLLEGDGNLRGDVRDQRIHSGVPALLVGRRQHSLTQLVVHGDLRHRTLADLVFQLRVQPVHGLLHVVQFADRPGLLQHTERL